MPDVDTPEPRPADDPSLPVTNASPAGDEQRPLADSAGEAPAAPVRPRLSERAASAAEVVFVSGVFSQLLLMLLFMAAGLDMRRADGTFSLTYVTVLSLADTAIIVGLSVMFLRARGESPRRVFAGARRPWREAVLGLATVPGVVLGVALLGVAIRWAAPWLRNVETNPLEQLMRNPREAAVFGVVAFFAGGVREEVQRAFILHRFRQHLGGAVPGLLLWSALFGLGHYAQGWDAAILTGVLGLLWGAIYLRRGSLVLPIVSHGGFNVAEILRQVLVQ